jgi:hypothetical protein
LRHVKAKKTGGLEREAKNPYCFHHCHHWLYSPKWAWAFLSECCHWLLSWAAVNKFLQPDFLVSSSTPSVQFDFGWSRPHWPPWFVHNIFFMRFVSLHSCNIACPPQPAGFDYLNHTWLIAEIF